MWVYAIPERFVTKFLQVIWLNNYGIDYSTIIICAYTSVLLQFGLHISQKQTLVIKSFRIFSIYLYLRLGNVQTTCAIDCWRIQISILCPITNEFKVVTRVLNIKMNTTDGKISEVYSNAQQNRLRQNRFFSLTKP